MKRKVIMTGKPLLKKIICIAATLVIIISTFSILANASNIMTCYNNVNSATSSVSISSTGLMTITNQYSASSSVFSKAVITTYIEKRFLGIFWTKVDIGQTNNEWVDTIYTNNYSGSHQHQLDSTGTYRVTVEYVISGSGGSPDTITKQIKKTY